MPPNNKQEAFQRFQDVGCSVRASLATLNRDMEGLESLFCGTLEMLSLILKP